MNKWLIISALLIAVGLSRLSMADDTPTAGTPAAPGFEDMTSAATKAKPAEHTPATRDELVKTADEAYDAGEYERALEYYTKAVPLIEDPAALSRVHERLAFIHAALGQQDKAYSEFVEALKLDQTLKLDQEQVSPKIYEAFQKARDEVVREGTLVCNCDPGGAEVYLDDALVGEAPVKKERIKEGEHTLTLKKPGYESSTGRITIKKDVTLTVDDKLPPARGEVVVTTEPPGATVIFDGKEAGTAPATVERVSAGEHKLAVRRDYFEPYETTLTLRKGEKAPVDIKLRRRLLVISVTDPDSGQAEKDALALIPDAFADAPSVIVIPTDMDKLESGLSARGLEPGALDFIATGKTSFDLQESAALSGVMEKDSVELAVAAYAQSDKGRLTLWLTLYSGMSDHGDPAVFSADDLDGLKKKLKDYVALWSGPARRLRPSIGAQVVDRSGGGAEVTHVLAGYPAAEAGVLPGDIILSVDGQATGGKDGLLARVKPGAKLTLKLDRRGAQREVVVSVGEYPAEVPLYSDSFLYNLTLVNYAGLLDRATDDKAASEGLAQDMMDIGNVFAHLGAFDKAAKAYGKVVTKSASGICQGTALFRLASVYERESLWNEAAFAYRKVIKLYPDATLDSADGPLAAPLAVSRLKWMYDMGFVRERWWR